MISLPEAEERLAKVPWRTRPEAQAILACLDGESGRTRVVGGAVRDAILARLTPQSDIDMASELTPQEVTARAEASGIATYPTGIEHGTVTLRLGDFTTEVTTLREDVETDGRHALVRFGTNWQADAARRDFTMNALYADMDGSLFDPLGGLADCLAARVRFIGDPDKRILEDRLRVYRFFRFSASHGGQVFDNDGLSAAERAAGELGQLSAERVGAEMVRMLSLPAIAKTLITMRGAGILEISPDGMETLSRYEEKVPDPSLLGRLALIACEKGLAEIQSAWRLSNRQVAFVQAIGRAVRLLRAGEENEAFYRHAEVIGDAVGVAAACDDWPSRKVAGLSDRSGKSPPIFPLTGGDLVAAGMEPGKALGDELARLERMWIESGFVMTKAELLGALRI